MWFSSDKTKSNFTRRINLDHCFTFRPSTGEGGSATIVFVAPSGHLEVWSYKDLKDRDNDVDRLANVLNPNHGMHLKVTHG